MYLLDGVGHAGSLAAGLRKLPCFRLFAAPSEADELKHPLKANTDC